MQSRIQRILLNATPQEIKEFSQYAAVVCALSHLYPTALAEKKVRERVGAIDEWVWSLLDLIYTHKLCTIDELRHWLYRYEWEQSWMHATLPSNQMPDLGDTYKTKEWEIHQTPESWLTIKGEGKVYKRTLQKDLAIALK
jgi:hypothetical protein